MKTRFQMILLLVVTSFATNVLAQEVSIPDPGLNAAIRETLPKPAGPLTAGDLLGLRGLDASGRSVRSLEGLGAAHNLATLYLNDNQLTDVTSLAGLTNLSTLNLHNNGLTNLTLPADLTNLTTLVLYNNQLTSLTLPAGLTSLTSLLLGDNQFTSFTLPAGLTNLSTLDLQYNQLTSLTLPAGLTNLTELYLGGNQLTNLTLPADLTSLTTLDLGDHPLLKTFALSELLAVTGLADQVANLTGQGVSIYVYRRLEGGREIQFPLTVSLDSGQRTTAGTFQFALTGPPGAYAILGSADLAVWNELGTLTNELGTAVFTDSTVKNSFQNFYRARTAP